MKDLRIKVVEENLFIGIKRSDEKEVIIMIDSEDNVTIDKHERKVVSSENNVKKKKILNTGSKCESNNVKKDYIEELKEFFCISDFDLD